MREIRDLDHARRWGVARFLNEQSVAEHSFFVSVYCAWIWRAMNRPPSAEFARLLDWAIFHDAAEQFTTDIPGPVKRAIVNEERLKAYEAEGLMARYGRFVPTSAPDPLAAAITKLADLLDECAYLIGEQRLGNSTVGELLKASTDRMHVALAHLCTMIEFGEYERVLDLVHQILQSERIGNSKQPR